MARAALTPVDLLRVPWLARLARSRWPQLLLTVALLGGFVLAIVAGLAGTPVGNRNFGIVGVWIAWWAALILILVPLLGRGWCGVCPLGAVGDWLQRGAVLAPGPRGFGLGRRWPARLRGLWLQNAGFVLLAVSSAAILTRPRVTGVVLLVLLAAALLVSWVFERRAFCRYLCPVGGFVGLYSQLAPIELRVRDKRWCAAHREKTCFVGCAEGSGCPWQVYPGALDRNPPCGLCLECVRTCPYDNIALNWRGLRNDFATAPGHRLDEAFKAFIMLGSALVYAAVFLGPWGTLKAAALGVGTGAWLAYAGVVTALLLAVLPGAFLLAVFAGRGLSRSALPLRRAFALHAGALVPLGLAAWIAFTLSLVLVNGSYVGAVASDPFGWGWNLFGTAEARWAPALTGLLPVAQSAVLLAGLGLTTMVAVRLAPQGHAERPLGQATPVVLFALGVTLAMLRLLVG
jgi:polyferredoxin